MDWRGVDFLWIIVMFLSTVWTLVLTTFLTDFYFVLKLYVHYNEGFASVFCAQASQHITITDGSVTMIDLR